MFSNGRDLPDPYGPALVVLPRVPAAHLEAMRAFLHGYEGILNFNYKVRSRCVCRTPARKPERTRIAQFFPH